MPDDEVKTIQIVSQADLVRIRLLQMKAAQFRRELRILQLEIERERHSISDALLMGAEVEEGPHVAYLRQSMKLEVL